MTARFAQDVQPDSEDSPGAFTFALREGTEGDLNFVADSWRRSYGDGGEWTKCPGGLPEYIATQRQFIAQALSTSRVLVAFPETPERRPAQVLGWCCYRPPSVLHYVFVKPFYRESGVARALLTAAFPERRRIFTTFGLRKSADCEGGAPAAREKAAGAWALAAKAAAEGCVVSYNPALIFGTGE